MQMEFFEQSINMTECTDLAQAAELTWKWLCENLYELPEDDRRHMLNEITDRFIDNSPTKCPTLESEQQSALEEGINRAKANMEQQLEPPDKYVPSQWMLDAMENADENMRQE